MEKTKYRYETGSGGEIMESRGDLMEVVACIGRQAQIIYTRLKDRDRMAAQAFREMVGVVFADADSPIWQERADVRQGIDIFHMKRENRGGGV